MRAKTATEDSLLEENAELRTRLEEAQEELRAIHSGAVDALVVEGASGPQVFTLQGVDAESNRWRGEILAQVSDAVIAVDGEQRVTYLNAAAERQYGVTGSEALGRRLTEIYESRWSSADEEAAAATALRERGEWRGENTHIVRDGREVSVESSVTMMRDTAGRPAGVLAVIRDISERKRVEDALRKNAALFSRLVEQAPTGMYVVDSQFRVRQVNALAQPVFETVHPLIDRDFSEVLQILWGPELGSQIAGIFRHTLETGEHYVSPRFWERRHDIGVEQSYEWETQRVTLADGQHAVVCYFTDITERARVQKAISMLAAIVESSDDAIIAKGLDGTVLSWNAGAERLFGYRADEILGKSITLLVPRERLAEEEQTLARLRRGERSEHLDTVRLAKDGRRIDVSVTSSPLKDGDGEVIGASKIVRDITERKRAEAILRDADEKKDNFIATLAHELRNPLAPIRNAVHMLRQKEPADRQLAWCRDVIDRQVVQMVRLLDDLLDVSRITRGRLTLRRERIDFTTVIEHAIEVARPFIDTAGHVFTVTLPAPPVRLDGDLTRLAQVFSNLLINAAKYTEARGRIALTAQRKADEVVVTVKDTGIGIAADNLPRIFELFGQVDAALERSQGGLGIGLSLVKGLVEIHGGQISAHSEGLGKGSEFVVRLPVASVTGRPEPLAATPEARHSAGRKCRILVADDSQDNADSLAMLLAAMGNDVRIAYGGEQALQMAESFRPEVAFIDLGMPKLTGYEVCRRIREQPWGAQMVLVAQSGWGREEDRRRTREAGFDHHFVKPFEPSAVAELLRARVNPS